MLRVCGRLERKLLELQRCKADEENMGFSEFLRIDRMDEECRAKC